MNSVLVPMRATNERVQMNHAQKDTRFIVYSGVAGLSSGLLTSYASASHILGNAGSLFLPGIIFGLAIAVWLRLCSCLCSIWKMIIFMAGCVVASYLSIAAALLVHLHLTLRLDAFRTRTSPIAPETYFAGGFTGACLILLTTLFLTEPHRSLGDTLMGALAGALVGGGLGVAAEEASSVLYGSYGHMLPYLARAGGADAVLIIFWETGMALVLAFTLFACSNLNRNSQN
ncbi:MAG TPA: hypothetical protein VFP59_20215 [Candidatus Angelobacter sp.]|nr:hypothetical protein [Candidatus Angelobacter sp.]